MGYALLGILLVPRIAVMPFKDLMESRGAVGEALRETVTADLKEVPGLQVIERAQIDRVIAELKLESAKNDLGSVATMKVGSLLSATLVVVGSYQAVGGTARVSARFVDVKTGEVIGAAKVDGPIADFLKLQDRVTVELLKSAQIAPQHRAPVAKRVRPKLKSLKPLELYGDAVVEPDEAKRRGLLVAALGEEPAFQYARRDLDALEQRLKRYEAQAQAVETRTLEQQKAQLAAETDPQKQATLRASLLAGLHQARRFRRLLAEARAIPDDPTAAYYVVLAHAMLKERQEVLRAGEAYLKRHPGTPFYRGVESYVQTAMTELRKEADGRKQAAELVAKLSGDDRWDLCYLGAIYRDFAQYRESARLFRTCLEVGQKPKLEVLRDLVWVDLQAGDWAAVRADLQACEKEGDGTVSGSRGFIEAQVPTDG